MKMAKAFDEHITAHQGEHTRREDFEAGFMAAQALVRKAVQRALHAAFLDFKSRGLYGAELLKDWEKYIDKEYK